MVEVQGQRRHESDRMLSTMDSQDAWSKLDEYREMLNAEDWQWVIPRQDSIGNMVGQLVESSVSWPVMSGTHWPSDYPIVQLQWVETAMHNLEADPTLADRLGPKDVWIVTADRLDDLVDLMTGGDWVGRATEAQQLVGAINSKAADQIGDLVDKHSVFGEADYPTARDQIIGVIRGASMRARLHGPIEGRGSP